MFTVEALTYQQTTLVHLQKKYLMNTLGFTALLITVHRFYQINLCVLVTELLKSATSFLLAVLPASSFTYSVFGVIITRPASFVHWRFFSSQFVVPSFCILAS